jgi:hypothetical protein
MKCIEATDADPKKAKNPSKSCRGWDERILPIMNYGKGFAFLLFFTIAHALTTVFLICFMSGSSGQEL